MGSCAGKSNSAAVVSAHIQPVGPQNPPPHNQAAPIHNENHQQVPQPNKYEEAQKPHNPNQYIAQHPDALNQPQRDEHSNNTTKLEEKPNKPQHGYDDIDEDAFASQLHKKEAPKVVAEKKKEENLVADTFALNFYVTAIKPANQFINNDNAKKEGKVVEENRRYQSKHKEKNVKNIIDNPDEMEQSFSSQGEARKIIENGDDDDFDVVENAKRNSHRVNENNTRDHKHQQSLSNNSQQNFVVLHEQQRQPNRASLTESASPSSGVIKNKTPEKEKVIEVQEAQEQHYHHEVIHHEHNEHHEQHGQLQEHPDPVQEKHEIIHHEPSYVQEKKVHKEEEPIHHHQEKKTEQVKSPERVLETRKENIEEPMEFDDPPLKIIDTPKKKETASPQKNTMKVSQEKMPWERNSVPYEDENEIEFFDDELES